MIEANRIEMVRQARLRPVALPAEHGGWSLLAEPIVLGLLIAPSTSGAFIALAALAAFLARHPLKLAIGDLRRKRPMPRTVLAQRFVLLYSSLAILSFGFALTTARTPFLLPLLLAAPFAVIQFIYDAKGSSRALLPELAGATGIASVVAAITLAGGHTSPVAFALWAVMTARVIPTILYLRIRLRRLRGMAASSYVPLAAHVAAVLLGTAIATTGTLSVLSVGALLMLLARAVTGLRSRDMTVRAKTLGLRELIYGAVFVIAVFAGNRFGW